MADRARTAARRTSKFLKPATRELVRARVLADAEDRPPRAMAGEIAPAPVAAPAAEVDLADDAPPDPARRLGPDDAPDEPVESA